MDASGFLGGALILSAVLLVASKQTFSGRNAEEPKKL
jgi:hypothetical protein